MVLRTPSSKTAHCDPIIQPFLSPGKAENKTNGPKPISTVSNQTYSPITSDLDDYRHLSSNKVSYQEKINGKNKKMYQNYIKSGL